MTLPEGEHVKQQNRSLSKGVVMSLRHLCTPRLRGSLLLGSLLFASAFTTQAADEMLRKAVGKGAYEMAYSQQENALWVATSQSRKIDKGGGGLPAGSGFSGNYSGHSQ